MLAQEKTQINVQLLEPVHRYYVLGEVNSPGSYPLDGHENVLDGILAAGGLTTAAAPCKILLARPTLSSSCRVTLPVCYREITQLGDTTTNYQIQPGDRIFVASRTWCEELMFWNATKSVPVAVIAKRPVSTHRSSVTSIRSHCKSVPLSEPCRTVESESIGRRLSFHGQFDDQSSPVNRSESIVVEATNLDADINSGPTADSRQFSPIETPLSPARLPTGQDGELDFEPIESAERFEPLWITPTSDAAPSE